MRFDLADADAGGGLAAVIGTRVRLEEPDGVLLAVFTADRPGECAMPRRDLVDCLQDLLNDLLVDAFLLAGDRLWSYLCTDPRCCPPSGRRLDPHSSGALALASANALAGRGVLPDRDAVVRSIDYAGGVTSREEMNVLLGAARRRRGSQDLAERRLAVRQLLSRLSAASQDPRFVVGAEDAADLTTLCDDVVVRDEVLIRCAEQRRRQLIMRVLIGVVRQVPAPHDAAVCASLAWAAYAGGDGVVANVAIERGLRSDPGYSLALLICDALQRQVPPALLEEVMRGAARDLSGRSAAG
jgi:hypothetical protein